MNGRRRRARRGGRCLRHLLAVQVALALTLGLAPRADAAVPAGDAHAKSRILFNIGADAYAAGDYDAALQAFDEARKLEPDPALTFSIAQAHRRQYQSGQSIAHLRAAIAQYHRYLDEVPKGGRRGDAAEALLELEPKLVAATAAGETGELAARSATRLVVPKRIEGTLVSVDGAPPEPAPFFGKIEPSDHVITVTAPGYQPYVRTITVTAGEIHPLDPELVPVPAALLVRGPDGATVWVDGRIRGLLPLTSPVAVPPGRRLVGITLDGHRRFELELVLDKGQRKDLDVALEPTAQRTMSLVTLSIGGASLLAGGVFAAVAGAVYEESSAVRDEYDTGRIDAAELTAYNQDRDAHRPYAITAIVTGAAGVGLGLVGLMLYSVDTPAPPSQTAAHHEPSVRLRLGVVPTDRGAFVAGRVGF